MFRSAFKPTLTAALLVLMNLTLASQDNSELETQKPTSSDPSAKAIAIGEEPKKNRGRKDDGAAKIIVGRPYHQGQLMTHNNLLQGFDLSSKGQIMAQQKAATM